MKRPLPLLAFVAVVILVPIPAGSHGPVPHGDGPQRRSGGEEDMKAQHERMARFREAARTLNDALVAGDRKGAGEAAGAILGALAGHESDSPHRNRGRSKEFHRLFVELEKRTESMRSRLATGPFPKAAAAYGRVLETCVACHVTFRD